MRKLLLIFAIIAALIPQAKGNPIDPQWASLGFVPSSPIRIINLDNLHIEYEDIIKDNDINIVDINEILKPTEIEKTCVPGRIPTFAFVGVISAVGTYTLYGAGAGIVTAGLVYICTNGNRHHTRMAIWGCLAGMAVGGVAKWISVR